MTSGLLYAQAAALSGANVVLSDMAEMMQLMQINTKANEQILLDCPGTTVLPTNFLQAYLLTFCDDEICSYRPDCRIYVLCPAKALAAELLPVAVYNHALQICIGMLTETNLHRVLQAAFRHCAYCSGAAVYQIIPMAQPSCNLT